MSKTVIIAVVLVILAGVGGFFGGVFYQKSQRVNFAGGFARGNGQFAGRFGQNGARPVRGQVLSIDSTGLTVKMMDGSSKIVVVSGSTQFMKSATASKDDVKTGDTVMVFGTTNSDGSVTAQNVAINPAIGGTPTPTGTK